MANRLWFIMPAQGSRKPTAVASGFLSGPLRGIVPAQVARVIFWESFGYHNRGDSWREERYWGD